MKTGFDEPTERPRRYTGESIIGRTFRRDGVELSNERERYDRFAAALEDVWSRPWVEDEHPDHRKEQQ